MTDISSKEITEMRERYASGETQGSLASEYGIKKAIVGLIVRGEIYTGVGGPITQDRAAASLTDEDVVEMREWYAAGECTYQDLSDRYGMSVNMCGHIVRGLAYQWAGGPCTRHTPKVTDEDAQEIRQIYASGGASQKSLGQAYGLSQSDVGKIVRGETWQHAGGPITIHGGGKGIPRSKAGKRALSEDQAMDLLIAHHYQGKTISDLSRQYEIDYKAVQRMVQGETYKDVDVPVFSRPDCEQIRGLYTQGTSVGRIAALYQVSPKIISAVIKEAQERSGTRGEAWPGEW